jgi:hypothetical protein
LSFSLPFLQSFIHCMHWRHPLEHKNHGHNRIGWECGWYGRGAWHICMPMAIAPSYISPFVGRDSHLSSILSPAHTLPPSLCYDSSSRPRNPPPRNWCVMQSRLVRLIRMQLFLLIRRRCGAPNFNNA